MVLSEDRKNSYIKRLLLSRMRILSKHGFYGLLLMHMKFSVNETCETAATDGKYIIFGVDFLEKINDKELDFVMMHEILHIVLKHCFRDEKRDPELFNIACDIVVNSNILYSNNMDVSTITLKEYGELMHLTPDGREGYEFTAEEVYNIILKKLPKKNRDKCRGWDDHSQWSRNSKNSNNSNNDIILKEQWNKWFQDAYKAVSIREASGNTGSMPLFAKRLYDEMKKGGLNWREILNNFIQEDVNDYTFFPPDRRYMDNPFFLPDFNEKDEYVSNIWFVVDTSGSISDKAIGAAYSEISAAIEQFNGKLNGMISFFEAGITAPISFCGEEELREIKPVGGGGTNFSEIFKYMSENMMDNPPAEVIIITDGYAEFPPETDSLSVPVLWLINNMKVTPPWGKVGRILVE